MNGIMILLHCRVNAGGLLEFTLKCSHADTVELLANTLLPQAISNPF